MKKVLKRRNSEADFVREEKLNSMHIIKDHDLDHFKTMESIKNEKEMNKLRI